MPEAVTEWSDVLTRPLLLTVTASRIARAVVLYRLSRERDAWVTPDEIGRFIHEQVGWAPSEDTLYNGILATLRGKERVPKGGVRQEPVVNVRALKGGENHRWTAYQINTAGLTLLEQERSKLIGPGAPLSAALHGLQHLAGVIGRYESPADHLVTNLNVFLRWLVLHTLMEVGPSSVPTIATYAYGCAGQISFVPQGGVVMERWPRDEVIRRAVGELQDEKHKLFGVKKGGSIVTITETGELLYTRWKPHLSQAVARSIRLAQGAISLLD